MWLVYFIEPLENRTALQAIKITLVILLRHLSTLFQSYWAYVNVTTLQLSLFLFSDFENGLPEASDLSSFYVCWWM